MNEVSGAVAPASCSGTGLPRTPGNPETAFLLSAACPWADADRHAALPGLAQQVSDWNWVRDTAIRQGVAPYLHQHAATLEDFLPADVRVYLEDQFYATAARNGFLAQTLGQLAGRFAAASLPMFAFKGPTLALSAYGSLALRHAGDLDLFIRAEDRIRATELLEAAGYTGESSTEDNEQHFSDGGGRVTLDLHWAVASSHSRHLVPRAVWWERVQLANLGGTSVPSLPPEELLLLLCVNATRSRRRIFLSNVCDIAALVRAHPQLDWARVLAEARGQRCLVHLLAGVRLASRLWPLSLPRTVRSLANSHPQSHGLAAMLHRRLKQFGSSYNPLQEAQYLLLTASSPREAAAAVLPLVTPNQKDFDTVRFPPVLRPLYFLMRPVRLLRNYGLSLQRHPRQTARKDEL